MNLGIYNYASGMTTHQISVQRGWSRRTCDLLRFAFLVYHFLFSYIILRLAPSPHRYIDRFWRSAQGDAFWGPRWNDSHSRGQIP